MSCNMRTWLRGSVQSMSVFATICQAVIACWQRTATRRCKPSRASAISSIPGPCGRGVAIEHNASVYACDHYVYPEYRIGSLERGRLEEVVLSRPQVKFGYAKGETLPKQCRECPYLQDCWGECPKNRILRTPDGEVAYRRCSPVHHPHLICRRCGRTEEVAGDALEEWSQQVATAHGFREPEHFVEVYGLCSSC